MPTTVVRARQKGVTGYVSVARPSLMGNPWRIGDWNAELGRKMDLADVLMLYGEYFPRRMREDAAFRAAALALRGKTVGCPCPGAGLGRGPDGEPRCHGHILASAIDVWEE